MARRTRRKYYKRKLGRWSPNIQEVGGNMTATPGIWSYTDQIMANPIQQPSFASQTYTAKNVEISFTFDYQNDDVGGALLENITAYIMFAPQGMDITSDYNLQHPEYILAYKYIGSPSQEFSQQNVLGQQYQPYRIKTRLSRKLQTGDSLVLFIKGVNQSPDTSYSLRISGIIRWWTKAN